jgi:hypothetical protein
MRSIQEAPQSNRGGPGRVRRRCVVADPGCGDREFATSSDVADGRSSLPQDGRSGGLCARGLDESRSGERSHSDQRPTPSDTRRHLGLGYSELSAFLEVVRAPSSLSFTEGQPAPDRVPKCTSVAVYELNATTQALRNRTRRTRIHVERYWPARCGLRTSDTYERCSSSPARLRPPSFRLLGVPLLQPPGPALSPS